LAVKYERLNVVENLTQVLGIDLNRVDDDGETPFCEAVKKNNFEMVRYLLSLREIDTNTVCQWTTPLKRVIFREDQKVLDLMIKSGRVDLNLTTDDDESAPIHYAFTTGKLNAFKALVASTKTDLNKKLSGSTVLLRAVADEKLEFVQVLVDCVGRIDLNLADENGNTPFHKAVISKNLEIISLLLNSPEIDVNTVNVNKISPLEKAIIQYDSNDADIFGLLMSSEKIDVNRASADGGKPPIHLALSSGLMMPAFKMLAESPATDLNQKYNGFTVLHKSVQAQNLKAVKILTGCVDRVDINVRGGENGLTALDYAVRESNPEIVKLLVSFDGINVNSVDESGQSTLIRAIGNSTIAEGMEVLRMICAVEGLDGNGRNERGTSPLQAAILTDSVEIVQEILKIRGIDVNSINSKNQSARQFSEMRGSDEAIKTLFK
jgi:ankyrin repeat protein